MATLTVIYFVPHTYYKICRQVAVGALTLAICSNVTYAASGPCVKRHSIPKFYNCTTLHSKQPPTPLLMSQIGDQSVATASPKPGCTFLARGTGRLMRGSPNVPYTRAGRDYIRRGGVARDVLAWSAVVDGSILGHPLNSPVTPLRPQRGGRRLESQYIINSN